MKTRSSNPPSPNSKHSFSLIHAKRVHSRLSFSPLAFDAPVQDYRGFHNLFMLLLFVNNLRLVVENYLKYGFLLTLPRYSRSDLSNALLILCLQVIPVLIILITENTVAFIKGITKPLKSKDGDCLDGEGDILLSAHLHSRPVHPHNQSSPNTTLTSSSDEKSDTNTVVVVKVLKPNTPWWANMIFFTAISCLGVLSNIFVFYNVKNPTLASIPTFWSVILVMKLISYVLVNAELRAATGAGISIEDYDASMAYPRNLTLGNMLYFLAAPTLCYQPSYPQSPRFRKGFFVKRLLELASLLGMMWFIAEQYSCPTLQNSLQPFHDLNWFSLFERILKLSIPSVYIWLLMFYAFFHSYLNMWAEIIRFGDREFYKPWWNASTIAQYWRLWNIPVYTFFKRHVYLPLRVTYPRIPRSAANAVAFLISAIGHEVVIGVPTHVLQGWAFGGMIAQIPMIWISDVLYSYEKKRTRKRKFKSGEKVPDVDELDSVEKGRAVNTGNYLFWISFCILGQPLCILLYYRAFYIANQLAESTVQ